MTPSEKHPDFEDKCIDILSEITELLQSFSQKFTEIHEHVKTTRGSSPPSLLDKETLCRTLKITERTLYRLIKEFCIPVHKLGKRLYFYWEEVEESLSEKQA